MKKIIIILGIAFLPIIANAETVKIDGIWYQTDHCFGAATKNRDFFLMKEDEE